ncbi:hypothetical protein EVAR_70362_1 [Eumeta japonica]|uniref:Uncharacterized protein n=1 Tax=Eumeta variegata TaxID=151549 RepID=A0A4C1TID6_EUMVA|nr:hypothetical protein EVAR_70362_1 [Eumeta japonica]
MANPNNLIRAPILNNPPPNINNPPQPQCQFVLTPENEASIANIVRRILLEEPTLRKVEPRAKDQGIDRDEVDLTQLERIPDVVRSLGEFDGNRTEFGTWKKVQKEY